MRAPRVPPDYGGVRSQPLRGREDTQPPLVPMSADELAAAARLLAAKIREREELVGEHAEQQAEFKAARETLDNDIAAIASTIRSQGR